MSLRIEFQNIVARPDQSPVEVVQEAIAGATGFDVTASQYVAVGADPAARPQHHAIVSVTGPTAGLAAMLKKIVPLEFAVVRYGSSAGILLHTTEGIYADDNTGITSVRNWSNANVSPVRSGCVFKPNGPLATVQPDYALLLGRVDKP